MRGDLRNALEEAHQRHEHHEGVHGRFGAEKERRQGHAENLDPHQTVGDERHFQNPRTVSYEGGADER